MSFKSSAFDSVKCFVLIHEHHVQDCTATEHFHRFVSVQRWHLAPTTFPQSEMCVTQSSFNYCLTLRSRLMPYIFPLYVFFYLFCCHLSQIGTTMIFHQSSRYCGFYYAPLKIRSSDTRNLTRFVLSILLFIVHMNTMILETNGLNTFR